MISYFKSRKRLMLELQLKTRDYAELQDRYTKLLGRTLSIPPAPTLAQLGDLWAEAERHGAVEVDRARDWQKNTERYEVTIKFQTNKGSDIRAKGEGASIVEAMENSINEARALQAGVVFANA